MVMLVIGQKLYDRLNVDKYCMKEFQNELSVKWFGTELHSANVLSDLSIGEMNMNITELKLLYVHLMNVTLCISPAILAVTDVLHLYCVCKWLVFVYLINVVVLFLALSVYHMFVSTPDFWFMLSDDTCLCEDICSHVWPYFFHGLEVTRSDIRPQGYGHKPFNLVIADGHFNLSDGFVWVYMGFYTHFMILEGALISNKVNFCVKVFKCV